MVAAGAMAGFDGGCGTVDPQPLPPPPPPPPPVECVDLLDEASCSADTSCRAVYVEVPCVCPGCAPGAECPPCDCAPPTFVGCEDRTGCDGLDENTCNADPTCEALYATPACFSAPEQDPCVEPGCGGCTGEPSFAGCRERVACPLILCQPCEFGAVIDANGCATCECLPPPNPCAGLSESACIDAPGCDPTYGASGAQRPCDCAGAGCNCPEDPPIAPPAYSGCVPSPTSCEGLEEAVCSMTPGCHPEYAYPPCTGFCPEGDPNCGGGGDEFPACPPVFTHCAADQVPVYCHSDYDCPGGYCDYGAGGGATEPGDSDGSGARPAPPPGGLCVYVSCGDGGPIFCDALPPDCGPGAVVGAANGCWACFDARSCAPIGQPTDCSSDFDCPSGYCDGSSMGGGTSGGAAPPAEEDPGLRPIPPPPQGQCVYPSCGDGAPVFCDALPPTCGVGQVAGAWGGCWACFDARTCLPVGQPTGCYDDAECPNGYCDQANDGGAAPPGAGDRAFPVPPPPPGQCVFPSCDDGSQLTCRALTPVCAPGAVASVINGCWECRDARSCAPLCDPSTADCG